ncbi:MAG: branched-chain amino acid ABC transporter permease [Betaproteobacteria bacterium]|nr:hypothetical protein [Rhodocyclaceae bacterium]HMM72783.1 branched-chain amino acid ABC transporter permease [Rhodocyclaceae bacterium]
MIYRETGQYKISYGADEQIFPIKQDRYVILAVLLFAFLVMPFLGNDYWFGAILIPFLILSLAALGLNILTGYAGQLSLGSAGFMAVGAFAAYNFMLRIDGMPFLLAFFLSGLCAAAVGIVFGLPSLRVKGFYLAAATLASQFFIEWVLTKFPWFTNHSASGVITAQKMELFGFAFDTPTSRYLLTLSIVTLLALFAKNLVRTRTGRDWMAVRDMDVAAEVIGIPILRTKLLAFAISSFYLGIAGALWAYTYLGTVEPQAFELNRSFQILFMVIIGGMGTIVGAFFGAAFIVLVPIFLNLLSSGLFGGAVDPGMLAHMEQLVFGAMIIFFLIVEPLGLARLWQLGKQKLRLWPFPH